MKNILSYQFGLFTGQQIIEWAEYQVENKTSHQKAGRFILNHYKLIPHNTYRVRSNCRGTGCGQRISRPFITRI